HFTKGEALFLYPLFPIPTPTEILHYPHTPHTKESSPNGELQTHPYQDSFFEIPFRLGATSACFLGLAAMDGSIMLDLFCWFSVFRAL
ncbi:hypothetical protein, partial [Paenibacillus barengoltzii]|uniref:hypothetical protein n=1 Tax=Paenibacillus barengoltzii TaxID=343517 RepID=UPI00387A4F9A